MIFTKIYHFSGKTHLYSSEGNLKLNSLNFNRNILQEKLNFLLSYYFFSHKQKKTYESPPDRTYKSNSNNYLYTT
jgi:hypothetical protein